MKTVSAVLILGILPFPALSDDASDRGCVAAVTSRHDAREIKATRISDFSPVPGFKDDKTSRKIEIDVQLESQRVTYTYVCRTEPGKESAVQLMGIK